MHSVSLKHYCLDGNQFLIRAFIKDLQAKHWTKQTAKLQILLHLVKRLYGQEKEQHITTLKFIFFGNSSTLSIGNGVVKL